MPASISAIVRTFPHPAPAKGSSLIHLGFSPKPSKQGTLYLRASSMADHAPPDAVIQAERDEDCSRICPLHTIALPSQHRMTRRALRTANSLYATALYACCPAHLAPAAAHCGEGINETADSYSLRGCGVPGTAIRYSAGNKQPCHSLFSASAPRAPRLPPKSIDRSGNQGHHYRLLLHVVLLKSCLALLLKPSFHSRIISRWPAKIIVACLNCSPLPSAMRACIELAAPARNPLFRSLHDIRTKPMKPSQAVLAERTRFNRI